MAFTSSEIVMFNNKSQSNDSINTDLTCATDGDMPVTSINVVSSETANLLNSREKIEQHGKEYDEFMSKILKPQLTNLEVLVHLLMESFGPGILAMPYVFHTSGVFHGIFGIFITGILTTYCTIMLTNSRNLLRERTDKSCSEFSDITAVAFIFGPRFIRSFSERMRKSVSSMIFRGEIGNCLVCLSIVSLNLKKIWEGEGENWNVRYFSIILLPFIFIINMIKTFKYEVIFSMVSSFLLCTAICLSFYFIHQDRQSISEYRLLLPQSGGWHEMSFLIAVFMFSVQNINFQAIKMEPNMKNPKHLYRILSLGTIILIFCHVLVGLLGYLTYGDKTEPIITMNLPLDEPMAQSIRTMTIISVLSTYMLKYAAPMKFLRESLNSRCDFSKVKTECKFRVGYALFLVILIIGVPNAAFIMAFFGAATVIIACLILPPIIEILTYYEEPGFGILYWRLWKNLTIMIFTSILFIACAYTSIRCILFGRN